MNDFHDAACPAVDLGVVAERDNALVPFAIAIASLQQFDDQVFDSRVGDRIEVAAHGDRPSGIQPDRGQHT